MSNIKILLADDDQDHQRLLMHALTSQRDSVEVVAVSNREQLLEAAKTGKFNCILLDYNIPPFTAPELISDLVQFQKNVPRIVVSSSKEQRVVIESLRFGVSDFIRKDEAMSSASLWNRIDRAIEACQRELNERRRANRRIDSLKKLAETDQLTGMANRRYMERLIAEKRRRSDRRSNISFMMLDIDHFKSVNDSFGHGVGDRVLKDVAEIIRSHCRGADVPCRWGGEEFLIMRQTDSLTEAWVMADELRSKISQQVRIAETDRTVTVSIGVDIFPTRGLYSDSMTRADQAMYLAKESGRNRVCTWPMVAALDAAQTLQTRAELSPRQRLIALVGELTGSLGDTQLEHIGPHGRRVRDLVMRIAGEFVTEPEALDALRLAAEFHDIGKIGVPEALLASPNSLTQGERRLIDVHARFGADLFRACGASELAAGAVEGHHTRFDTEEPVAEGSELSHLLGAILSACDAIDAMLSHRAYAIPRSPSQVIQELCTNRGAQFHPKVVDTLQFLGQKSFAMAA